MKKGYFIVISKRMVLEYYNRYIKGKKTDKNITINNIKVVGFYEKDKNYKILMLVPSYNSLYFEVKYHKKNNEITSYIYKKTNFELVFPNDDSKYYKKYVLGKNK